MASSESPLVVCARQGHEGGGRRAAAQPGHLHLHAGAPRHAGLRLVRAVDLQPGGRLAGLRHPDLRHLLRGGGGAADRGGGPRRGLGRRYFSVATSFAQRRYSVQ